MGFTIDASKADDGNSGGGSFSKPAYMTEGKKLVWAAGIDWGESKAGNVKIDVRFACVQDPSGKDVGNQVWDTFTLTERAAWKVHQYARAAGQTEPFESDDKDAFEEMLSRRPVWTELVLETRQNGDQKPRPSTYSIFKGEITEEMDQVAREMEDYHQKGKEYMSNKGKANYGTSPTVDDNIPF